MQRAIRIIGIDPGLRRTGWGVIESDGHRLVFVASGTVTSNAKGELAHRLIQLEAQVERDKRRPRFRVSQEELGALRKLRQEASERGVQLRNEGELPSSQTLHVMRRDRYVCTKCGTHEHPLSVHDSRGTSLGARFVKRPGSDNMNSLVTICEQCDDTSEEVGNAQ